MTTTINASTSAGLVQTADTSGNLSLQSGGTTILALTSAGAAVTGTLSATGLTLDSSRNLGIQVTPSAGNKASIELGYVGNSVIGPAAGTLYLGDNFYQVTSSQKYANTGLGAAVMVMSENIFQFLSAPAGTAGNTISWTTVASISAEGELTNTCPTANKYSLTPVNSNASSPYGIYNRFTGADPNSTGNSFLYCEGSTAGGTLRAGIRSNGGLANYSGNNVNLSDLDVKPFTQAFDAEKLWRFGKAMRPAWMQFKYDDQTHDDWNNGYGAQLVQEAAGTDFPELVSLGNWGTKDEPKMRLEVYDNDLMHIMGAITTESQFKIEALEARLAALEAK